MHQVADRSRLRHHNDTIAYKRSGASLRQWEMDLFCLFLEVSVTFSVLFLCSFCAYIFLNYVMIILNLDFIKTRKIKYQEKVKNKFYFPSFETGFISFVNKAIDYVYQSIAPWLDRLLQIDLHVHEEKTCLINQFIGKLFLHTFRNIAHLLGQKKNWPFLMIFW